MKKHPFLFALLAVALLFAATYTARAAIGYLRLRPAFTGENVWARSAPGYVQARVLAANTAETNAVPSGASYVIFASTGTFYARPDGNVTVPAADVTDGTAGEINPTVWRLDNPTVTNIMVIAPAACVVTLSFYK